MPHPPALKASLKRGAFIAAANWPLIAVQFIAEGTQQLLLAVPVVGGMAMVVLLLGANVEEVVGNDVKGSIFSVLRALRANPVALGLFTTSFILVLVGASVLTFIVKAGTISILSAAESQAGPIERPPIRLATLRRANFTNIEPFLDGCRRFGRRFVRLGLCLLVVQGLTIGAAAAFVVGGYGLSDNPGVLLGWTVAAVLVLGAGFVWYALVSCFYLLTQMAIALEDVGVRDGMRRVVQFIRASIREVAAIFGVILLLVIIMTGASLLATAGLGLIAMVPFVGLAMVPLQLGAWLLRGFVSEYLGLTALGAYLTQYRYYQHSLASVHLPEPATDVTGPRLA
jgi:hypothetical protein